MKKGILERTKTFILIFLVLTSLIQVGILWGYESHGLPFNFIQILLANSAKKQEDIDEEMRKAFFTPFRILIYDGNYEAYPVLSTGSNHFYDLWNEAQYYLKEVAYSDNLERMEVGEWENALDNECYIFEFKNPLQAELVKWFLNISEDFEMDSIYKIALVPGSLNTVYVLGKSGLYKAEVPFNIDFKASRYKKIYTAVKKKETNEAYSLFMDVRLNNYIKNDVLVQINNTARIYAPVSAMIPDQIKNEKTVLLSEILLGADRNSYNITHSAGGYIVFQNRSNIYRIYPKEGRIDYRYTRKYYEDERGSVSSAFKNAYGFLTNIRNELIKNEQLFLSEVKQNLYSYSFIFNYKLDEYPFYFNNVSNYENAIEIKANKNRVVACSFFVRNLVPDIFGVSKNYNISHALSLFDRIDDLAKTKDSGIMVTDIMEGYVMYEKEGSAEPAWILSTYGDTYAIEMPEENN